MRRSRLARWLPVLMGGGGASASPLLTGLVSHWKMDETTGNRVDSHGDFDMVPFGTVGYDTGILGNCATMATGAGNYLQFVNDAILALSLNAITIAGWFYIPTAWAARSAVLHKSELYLIIDNGQITFSVGGVDGGSSAITLTTEITVDTWHFIAARFDKATDSKAKIALDGGNWVVSSIAIANQDVKNTSNYLRVNRSGATYGTCWYDSLSFWTRALQDSEIDLLYNEGAGLDYPFL